MVQFSPISLQDIEATSVQLAGQIVKTPSLQWESIEKDRLLGKETEVFVKLELFQHGGSFKTRGALMVMKELKEAELKKGVTAVSAGNHAIAVALAAKIVGTTAKVVMPNTANPGRIQRCKELGAEVVLVDNVSMAFVEVERIQKEEGRSFIHPFEGRLTALGTATVGHEFIHQVPELDAVIIPIGGGGLAAGIATAFRLERPNCRVFGVEPFGADTMYRSFQSGKPESLDKVRTIADSLGAPFSMPYSLDLCRKAIEKVVLITDEMMQNTMALMFTELKLAVEPAGAAALSALLGPLREELRGKRVGIIICGANTDFQSFSQQLQQAQTWS